MNVKQVKLPKSQIELEFELTAEEFNEHFEHALEHLKSHVKVDGFRPGQAPSKLVEGQLKPEMLLMEAGDHAAQHVYSEYVLKNKLEPVGQPEVSIIKIAKGSPFVFKAKITILPDVELPDYKEIASKVKTKEVSVTEQELQDALNYLQKSRAKMTLKDDVAQKGDFVEIEYSCGEINEGKPIDDRFILGQAGFMRGFEDNIVGLKAGQEKEFKQKDASGKENDFKVKLKSVQKVELPEINDEFAKQLGAFDTLAALKENMKKGMEQEKKEEEKQRRRGEILEKIAERLRFEAPETLVDYEKQRLLDDLRNRVVENMKLSFEQYLAAVKQTEDQLKETFKKEAEKRLRGFLILKEIGKRENIQVSGQEIEEELKKAPKTGVDIEQFKEYIKGVLFNEKVFEKLEN